MRLIAVVLSLLAGAASAQQRWGGLYQEAGTAPPSQFGQVLAVGGGGYVTGIDIKCNSGATCGNGIGASTMISRVDTYGAWYFNPNASPQCGNTPLPGCWQQVINSTSIGSTLANGTSINAGSIQQTQEFRIAPNNTSHFYIVWRHATIALGYVHRFETSTDSGSTWTNITGGWTDYNDADFNEGYRQNCCMLAVDPANDSVVFIGSPKTGIQYTSNAGGAVAALSTGPPASNGEQDNIAFDTTSTVTGGKTTGLYTCSNGTGVYHSTNANNGTTATFTELNSAGMPTSCQHLVVDQTGVVWVTDNNYNLFFYKSGAWTQATAANGNAQTVAVDPYNANAIVAVPAGGRRMFVSYDGGANWIGSGNGGVGATRLATDIPWLAATNESFMSQGDITFDPAQTQWTTSTTTNSFAASGTLTFTTAATNFGNLPLGTVVTLYQTGTPANIMQGTVASGSSGTTLKVTINVWSGTGTSTSSWTIGTERLFFSGGIGVWWGNPGIANAQTVTWTDFTAGIENMVTQGGTGPASGSCTEIILNLDRAFFKMPTSITTYPSNEFNGANGQAIVAGRAAGWAQNSPTNMFVIVGDTPGAQQLYTTTNCGGTLPLTSTTTQPADIAGNQANGYPGGSVTYPSADIAATTTSNLAIAQPYNGNYYSTDNGVTWNLIQITGIPTSGALTAGVGSSGTTIVLNANAPAWLASDATNSYQMFVWDVSTGACIGSGNCSSGGHLSTASAGSPNVTFTTAIGNSQGSSAINSGDQLNFFINKTQTNVVSDRVTDQTFYFGVAGGATGAGFYRSSNGGAAWTQRCAAGVGCPFGAFGGPVGAGLYAIPGNAGHLLMLNGLAGCGGCNPAAYSGLYYSTNGGTSWTQIATAGNNVESPSCAYAGPALAGSDGYPTIYTYAWINQGAGYVSGFWQVKNFDATPVWTAMPNSQPFPVGSLDPPWACFADGNNVGRAFLGFEGSSWQVYQRP